MRRAEPLEPEVEAALEAIDATLAGDPVDPEHAELAELSLILRSDRPAVRDSFAAAMDARVAGRFHSRMLGGYGRAAGGGGCGRRAGAGGGWCRRAPWRA